MPPPLLPVEFAALSTFEVVAVRDPREMDAASRVSQRLSGEGALFTYRLQDRSLLQASFDQPIAIMAGRCVGNMLICHSSNQFATQIDMQGDGINGFCFQIVLQGKVRLLRGESEVIESGANGAVLDGWPGAKILTSDASERQNLWIRTDALEHALEGMLGEQLHRRLQFAPGVDWSTGLAASLRGQIDFLIHEATRPDGVADNPVALASMTDLVLALALRGVAHNYLERLENIGRSSSVPAYIRRAEEFMRANAAAPIRMEQVAHAAGCSVRTLAAVFRHFRDTTPLAAMHAIRLEHMHAELSRNPARGSIAAMARRYGFTNPGRFVAAYRRRFGEAPSETTRRGLR